MKLIDSLYFNIYSYFLHTGVCKQSFNARFQAMYLFALGLGGWVLLLQALYLHSINSRFSTREASTLFAAVIFTLTGVLSHYIFIVKGRDMKISEKHEAAPGKTTKKQMNFLISLGVMLLPYVGLVSFAIFDRR